MNILLMPLDGAGVPALEVAEVAGVHLRGLGCGLKNGPSIIT